jgi:hypothetical protein
VTIVTEISSEFWLQSPVKTVPEAGIVEETIPVLSARWMANRSRVPLRRLVTGYSKLPIKAEIRKRIGKDVGDTVTVRLTERLSS